MMRSRTVVVTWGLGIILSGAMTGACKRAGDGAWSDAGATGGMSVSDAAVSIGDPIDAGDTLSGLPPPLSHRAAEAPAWNEKLLEDPLYARLWTPAGKGDLDLILTALSETISTVGADGHGGMPPAVMKALETGKLKELFFAATATPLRTGSLTPDFAQRIAGYLQYARNAPNMGVSASAKGVQPAVAFAGLAWWLYPNDPFYGREYLRSRKVGPYHWPATKSPWVSWLASEAGALRKLSSITTLTDAEVDRYNKLLAAALPRGGERRPGTVNGWRRRGRRRRRI